jgi:hypothetical protein
MKGRDVEINSLVDVNSSLVDSVKWGIPSPSRTNSRQAQRRTPEQPRSADRHRTLNAPSAERPSAERPSTERPSAERPSAERQRKPKSQSALNSLNSSPKSPSQRQSLSPPPERQVKSTIASKPNTLSWRSDPNSSFSDWTVEVTIKPKDVQESGNLKKETYHCHSNVLAWGPRRSEKFATIFQKRLKKNPNKSMVSKIELKQQQANVFPLLLDFLYCETHLPLSAEKACSLILLAEKLEIPTLQRAIRAYVEKSLNLDQVVEFITYARKYKAGDKLVFFANSKLCGYLVKHPELAGQVPPELLVHILHKRKCAIKVLKGEDPRKFSGDWEKKRSKQLSKVVAECVLKQYNNLQPSSLSDPMKSKCPLTRSIFNKLVHKQNLPHIEVEAALKLLQMDAILCKDEEAEVEQEALNNKVQRSIALSCLEERCLESLAYSWRDLMKKYDGVERENGSDDETDIDVPSMSLASLLESLRQFSPSVLADLLVLTSVQYEDKLAQSHRQSRRTKEILARKDSQSQNTGFNSQDAVHPKLLACGMVDQAEYGHAEARDEGDDDYERARSGVGSRVESMTTTNT